MGRAREDDAGRAAVQADGVDRQRVLVAAGDLRERLGERGVTASVLVVVRHRDLLGGRHEPCDREIDVRDERAWLELDRGEIAGSVVRLSVAFDPDVGSVGSELFAALFALQPEVGLRSVRESDELGVGIDLDAGRMEGALHGAIVVRSASDFLLLRTSGAGGGRKSEKRRKSMGVRRRLAAGCGTAATRDGADAP